MPQRFAETLPISKMLHACSKSAFSQSKNSLLWVTLELLPKHSFYARFPAAQTTQVNAFRFSLTVKIRFASLSKGA
jgi:hypothetical protein